MCTATVVICMAVALRGSSICDDCGQSNGNRATYCKSCSKPLRKVANLQHKPSAAEDAACFKAIYSVKLREQGPDYRCFVTQKTTPTDFSVISMSVSWLKIPHTTKVYYSYPPFYVAITELSFREQQR